MTKVDFINSVKDASPPTGIHPLLLALWYDAKGYWQKAHEAVQDMTSKGAAWIHAYLHRKEGDLINAKYWYMRAEQNMPEMDYDLEKEWNDILDSLEELL
ncbi:MAG TPA: hypothetical protein PK753_00320 [Ignavibacteria bacterium]|nr:hypothetical protein [Ignavibacteria bacterium]